MKRLSTWVSALLLISGSVTANTNPDQDTDFNEKQEYPSVKDLIDITVEGNEALPNCIDWSVEGVCFFLNCYGIPLPPFVKCDLHTSLEVRNHMPVLLMQSYRLANGEPITETKTINEVAFADADSSVLMDTISWLADVNLDGLRGGQTRQSHKYELSDVQFNFVDAYRHPMLVQYKALSAGLFGVTCSLENPGVPMTPHYISNLDFASWRTSLPELIQNPLASMDVVTGRYDLGSATERYAPMFPRTGFIYTYDPLISGIATAFRAAHFITRKNQAHVYVPFFQATTEIFKPAPPLEKNNAATGKWQMHFPVVDDDCHNFPYRSGDRARRRYDDSEPSSQGAYIWSFWKRYTCCRKRPGVLIKI